MTLVDQYGNPIRSEDLLTEEAKPSISGVRQVLSQVQSSGLSPQRLARLIRRADEGDTEAYLELAEELEEKDAHYNAVLGTRKRAVAQLDISVAPASDDEIDIKAAGLIEDWLNRDQLEDEMFDMLDAVGKGFSVTEIIWDTSANVWLPRDLKWRDPRWFEFSREDGETLYLKDETGAELLPLKPYKYIVHKSKAKSGIAIRGGVVRPCAWMWLFKNFAIKDWVIFCEAYGQPVRIGKYGAGASQAEKDTLMRAVANIGSDAAAIIPESMKIEFIEAVQKGATIDAFERLCKFADFQISKAVLGQTTTTDAVSSGLAGNQSHNDVRGDIERADAKKLAATLNQQLIPMIVSLNMGVLKRYPKLRIGRPDNIDADKLSQVAERGIKMGIKVSGSKLRDQLGLPAPENDEDTLQLPTAPEQPATASRAPVQRRELAAQENPEQPRPEIDKDAVDDIVAELSDDWEEIMTPMVDEIEQAIEETTSYDELKQKLLELSASAKSRKLAASLEKASVSLRMAGHAGAPLIEE